MRQQKCKLIVSDFDGTLADQSGIVSEHNKKAIQRHMDNGGYFTVATGRMKCGLQYAVREIFPNAPLISCQGAVIFHQKTGQTIAKRYIDHPTTLSLLSDLHKSGFDINLYVEDKLYVFDKYWYIDKYTKDSNIKDLIIDENLLDLVKKEKMQAQKILVCAEAEVALELETQHAQLYKDKLLVVRSSANFVEYNALNGSKGMAVRYVAELLGIPKQQIMCMGDSSNDISMFEECGISVAMGNAMPHVKQAAQYVFPDCKEDGAAFAIEKFGM